MYKVLHGVERDREKVFIGGTRACVTFFFFYFFNIFSCLCQKTMLKAVGYEPLTRSSNNVTFHARPYIESNYAIAICA